MPNILSSTSPAGGAPGQVRPASGQSSPAPGRAPIGQTFGAHLGRKAQTALTAPSARSKVDGPLSSGALQGDPDGAAAGRTGKGGVEAIDDDRQRSRSADACMGGDRIDPLDPLTRALFASGLRATAGIKSPAAPPPDDGVSRSSRVSLEQVLTRLVRRVAWSGDAQTGSARLELGAGALEGATLTIHSDQGQVRVSLELPSGVDPGPWRDRIARRLGARGLQVAALEVE